MGPSLLPAFWKGGRTLQKHRRGTLSVSWVKGVRRWLFVGAESPGRLHGGGSVWWAPGESWLFPGGQVWVGPHPHRGGPAGSCRLWGVGLGDWWFLSSEMRWSEVWVKMAVWSLWWMNVGRVTFSSLWTWLHLEAVRNAAVVWCLQRMGREARGFQRVCAQGLGCGWRRPGGDGGGAPLPSGRPCIPRPSHRAHESGSLEAGSELRGWPEPPSWMRLTKASSGVGPRALEPGGGGGNRPQLGGGGFAPGWWNAFLFQVLPGGVDHWNEQGPPTSLSWPVANEFWCPGSTGPGSLLSCVLRAREKREGQDAWVLTLAGRNDPDPRPLSSVSQNRVSLELWSPRKPGDGDAGVPGRETQN